MKTIKNKIFSILISIAIVATFMPIVSFGATDYAAIYEQKKAETQTAYQNWQNAVENEKIAYEAYKTAENNWNKSKETANTKLKDRLKKKRLLDLATRNAVQSMAEDAWKKDFPTLANETWNYKYQDRISAILAEDDSKVYTKPPQFIPQVVHDQFLEQLAKPVIENDIFNSDNVNYNNYNSYQERGCNYSHGITTSLNGDDNSFELNQYTAAVYLNLSYDSIMRSLNAIDELNSTRYKYKNDFYDHIYDNDTESRKDSQTTTLKLKVSPYMMLQSAVNLPRNNVDHMIDCYVSRETFSQNLGSWIPGDYISEGIVISEKSNNGGHYRNVVGPWTCVGISTGFGGFNIFGIDYSTGKRYNKTQTVFEQDFANIPNGTGYTTEEYKEKLNNRVSNEKGKFSTANLAFNIAANTEKEKGQLYSSKMYDWAEAKTTTDNTKAAYDNAVVAEEKARVDYENWQNNQDPGNNDPTPTVLSKVNNFKIENIGTENNKIKIRASWNPVDNAKSYVIYSSTDGINYNKHTEVTTTQVTFYISNSIYYFWCRAKNDSSIGLESDVATYNVTTNNSPAQVTGVTVRETHITETKNTLLISWNSANNATSYWVETSDNGSSWLPTGPISSTSFTMNNVTAGSTKYIRVYARNSYGSGPKSEVVRFTTTKKVVVQPSTPTPTPTEVSNSTVAVGTPYITKMAVTKKTKTVDISFGAAKNAKSYKVEIRRFYKLKGKKKIKSVTSWKAYTTKVNYKWGWKYDKKITAKVAKKYKNNKKYKLVKSGSKYKLYKKVKIAPVKATKLTRNSIYQVKVTAINGKVKKASKIKSFTIK